MTELALPAIVLGEYLDGIQQSRLRASYETWIKANLPFFDLLPIVRETAERLSTAPSDASRHARR
jgi:hypothetical protein